MPRRAPAVAGGPISEKRIAGVSPEDAAEIRQRLAGAFGERFCAIWAYGSRVRDDASPDSDMDLLLVLRPPIDLTTDLLAAARAVYPVQLRLDFPIHTVAVSATAFDGDDAPIYLHVREEGVCL